MAAKKTYVLWASKGPIATGDLAMLKVRAEKMVTKVVGAAGYKWEPVEKVEDDDWDTRVRLARKSIWDNWLDTPYFIDDVPVVEVKKKAGA